MESNPDYQSRSELFAEKALGKDATTIRSALRARTVVVGITEELAKTRPGQIGLVTAINILARLGVLVPNLFLDVPPNVVAMPGVPFLSAGVSVRDSLINFMTELAAFQTATPIRAVAPKQSRFDFGLFIGRLTLDTSSAITIGSRNWLAIVNPQGSAEQIHDGDTNPLGIILAAALGSCEIVKRLWLPIKDPQLVIEPIQDQTVVSAFDLRINPENPDNPAVPDVFTLGHACIIGLGAIGSGCNFVIGCLNQPHISLDFVDDDIIQPSNEERLFTCARPTSDMRKPKVFHACDFITALNSRAYTFPCRMKFEHFVNLDRNRLGYLFCCLDSAKARRALQTELPSVLVNGGTDMSRWMLSLHEFDRPENACLLDLYPPDTAQAPDAIRDLAGLLNLQPDQMQHFVERGKKLDPATILAAISREKDLRKKKVISEFRGLNYDEAVAKMCSQATPSRSIPAATISFVSLIPAVFMVADFMKRRLYNWKLPKGWQNVFQFDCFRRPESGTACNILASRDCFCQSERFSAAFDKRQEIRKAHLNRIFDVSAGPVQLHRHAPQPLRRIINKPPAPKPQTAKPQNENQQHRQSKLPQVLLRPKRFYGMVLWLAAISLYLSGMAVSIGLVGLFVQQECKEAHIFEVWRLPQLGWDADTTDWQWFKFTSVSALPVVAYPVLMAAATNMMRLGRDEFCGIAQRAKPIPPRNKLFAKILTGFFTITGLPCVSVGSAGVGAVNLHNLCIACSKALEVACCLAIPVFFFAICILFLICTAGIMQTFGPTWYRCAKVFHIAVPKPT